MNVLRQAERRVGSTKSAMRWGCGHRRAAAIGSLVIAIWANGCGKVEPSPGATPDAGALEDARSDRTTSDASGDASDAPSVTDAQRDAGVDTVTLDASRDTPTNDGPPPGDGASNNDAPASDGTPADRTPIPDADRDTLVPVDAPAVDGSTRCVLGQSKVGNCTL